MWHDYFSTGLAPTCRRFWISGCKLNPKCVLFWSIASLGAPGFVLQKMELGPGLQDNSLMEMESTQINACRQKLDVMTPPSRTHD